LKANELSIRVELERLSQFALNGEAGGQVRMIGGILAEGAWLLRVGDFFEFEEIVVERRDRLESAEANVEVAVETLRRSGRGYYERVRGGGGGADQPARQPGGGG
jgi:hypothetical protein